MRSMLCLGLALMGLAGPSWAQSVPAAPVAPAAAPATPQSASTAPSLDGGAANTAAEAPSAAQIAAAQQLMQATGQAKLADTLLGLLRNQMVSMIEHRPNPPSGDVGGIVDEVLLPEMRTHVAELLQQITRIYASSYTVDEMHELLAFFNTPLGQKMLTVAPKITQESIAAGRAWGQRVARQALADKAAELRVRGVQL